MSDKVQKGRWVTDVERIAELEAENERLRKKLEIAGAHPFPKDFDALDLAVERNKALLAENERLRNWKMFVLSKMHTDTDHFSDTPYRHWFAVFSKKPNPDKAILAALEESDE